MLKRLRKEVYSSFFLCVLIVLATLQKVDAKEGMWLPFLLNVLNEQEMQSMGLQLSAEDIYSANQSSLKDAIVHFGGGCTSELISAEGLLLTNHHCGYGQIQQHSSVENDLLRNGFWAMNRTEELRNPGLTATFVRYMEDVTEKVLRGTDAGMEQALKDSIIALNTKKLLGENNKDGRGYDLEIVPIFYGNQFIIIATETFKDVRLVGAPPSSIGKYGADTDNWVWPRHTGDFSLFRIYANAENQPADISDDNVPYKSEKFLKINTSGVQEGDFTMVFGFPGRTQEYLPYEGMRQIVAVEDPIRVAVRDVRLEELDRYMRQDDETRIKYAARYASVANGWKKWIGEMQGVEQTNGLGRKMQYEERYFEKLKEDMKLYQQYAEVLPSLNSAYLEREKSLKQSTYYIEVFYLGSMLNRKAFNLDRLLSNKTSSLSDEAMAEVKQLLNDRLDPISLEIEKNTLARLYPLFAEALPGGMGFQRMNDLSVEANGNWSDWLNKATASSVWVSEKTQKKFLKVLSKKGVEAAREWLEANDAFFQLHRASYQWYLESVRPEQARIDDAIADLMRSYMRAQMAVFKDRSFYPDANSTLRLSYGKVEGFSPSDGVIYNIQTDLDGVMEKYIPGDYEFDLPQQLIELHELKDYGEYATEDGRLPVCFIASNHTTGGNSGSPALNARGELIGLNFDRLWEGTMSDINYDASICRNIMVDIRYVLFVIDKFAGAKHLIQEMELTNLPVAQTATEAMP